ncbi:hypothetical protein [Paenibacillus sp. YYML68]|uniref:hypothetical protein n=1 Tax=Paenibacillus sp. YYML68 TaxID=2909250 RepID=UPI002491F44C|nr:hypothetical protein [Paenibacillus sp. YYML68]
MDTETRKTREMTYHTGWKQHKIVPSARPDAEDSSSAPTSGSGFMRAKSVLQRMKRLLEQQLWTPAPVPRGHRVLLAVLLAMPAALFALFVWAVQLLARQS